MRTARLIGSAVIHGELSPDHPLPVEGDIMRRFGVSRNVVRDAVKMLVGKGMLRTVRRAGTLIEPRQKWNLLDTDLLEWTMDSPPLKRALLDHLTQLRSILEPEVAALAARNASVTETLRITEAYEAMERHVKDPQRAIDADISFHERLFEAAHNDLLCSLLPALGTLLRANFQLSIHSKDGFIRNLREHRVIAEAVHNRDPELARQTMRKLLHNNEADIKTMLDGRVDVPPPTGQKQ